MTTYADMYGRVLSELTRNDITAQAQNAIQSAISFYEDTSFWFNDEIATASTTNGTEYYALPTDFRADRSLTCTVNGNSYPLRRQSQKTLDNWFINSSNYTGYPSDYGIYKEQFRLYPIPNGTYTLTLSYTKQLSALSADADTNAWMVEAEELIRSRAEYDLCMRVLKKPEWAALYRQLELDVFENLQSASIPYQSTGRRKKRAF